MIRTLFASLAFATLLAGSAAAQLQHTLDIDAARSPAMWDGNTSLGPLQGNKNFNFEGVAAVSLGGDGAPFLQGAFNGGDLYTVPATLTATIPNPLPFLPPLVRITVDNLHARADQDPTVLPNPFVVDAAGNFSTTIILTFTQGIVTIDPSVGSTTTTPLAGMQSDPFDIINGTVAETAGTVVLTVPIFLNIAFTGSVSGSFTMDGDVYASAPVPATNFTLSVPALTAGTSASFNVTGAYPGAATYMVYGISGPGSVFVPQLQVTLSIKSPVLANGPTAAGGNGSVSWTNNVPAGVTGATVRFQAAQWTFASNVVVSTIQ